MTLPLDDDSVLVHVATAAGVPRHRFLNLDWQRISRGLYARSLPDRPLIETAAMVAKVLPRRSGFGSLTSAELRGWWLPNQLSERRPLLATTTSEVHVQRNGLYVRRSTVADLEEIDRVPVVSGAQTLAELARDLSLVDLVPMVDCALRLGVDAESVLAAARPRMRGCRRLRQAVNLADERSESWWESVLRLMHVLTGLGPVACQAELWRSGVFVARADLHLVGTNRYPEYDGGAHRERHQHDADLGRDKRMSRAVHERYGYTGREIIHHPQMVIRDGEDARGWLHDPERVRTWLSLAGPSSLTSYGRTRLSARLRRYELAARRR
ncbi:MAG: hypothetical protein GEU96_07560 [Propionibacteriales bacterium]|nr:hypothetical protein [Propionibacteriales bacterium]